MVLSLLSHIECLFVESKDADKYDPEIIAKAIVNGLAGNNNSNKNQ